MANRTNHAVSINYAEAEVLYREGNTLKAVSAQLGCSYPTLKRYASRHGWSAGRRIEYPDVSGLPEAEQFVQLLRYEALELLQTILGMPFPRSWRELLLRERVLEKLQTRGRQAFGLDQPSGPTFNPIQLMSMIADTFESPPKRLRECSTPAQVVQD